MRFHIITIFPDIFDSYLNESIIGRAIKNKLISVGFYNPRDFIKAPKNNYKPVDHKPYGGGPGMVMRAEPILKAVEAVFKKITNYELRITNKKNRKSKILIINFIPNAEKFTTTYAKTISKKYTDVVLICGRYEGIDARVDKILKTKKLSIGDYVLTGGEIPAMILVDCVSRQIEGVLGNYDSREEERVSSSEVYTRPEVLKYPFNSVQGKKSKNYKVPKVLLSGNHKDIEEWRKRDK
ncbi:MAG: tRNA (guanine-N(1)-)-methyltransferase [Candidatus Nomurabacteria bacterium GW2011_GWE1_32_28]|uniref:tRNA (guanine-N(1)-)-methyltransferase n=1 Tax=Candidatus Nomurabacteria bacterium GW2011_GWF1_31_48 TaxID=1618767 RepID=A0A0F9YEV7_9BACT|nr:MAG: tRNA (guanine-N(1)-)-methyltransferase [Candidatus Nomurabacteria bacterium GW2011_GWF2_30_133]KKP28613.1 MAG: tRNA (guanine-N(1)-)-methyltransferase [Candidatus Nomurabacteria bacterium GW2011_GWE2_31_40]KKP30189.1 MAG: tRNA (guanine-N(1)-)-methyltransferase [Candidatus Nomurabacteria bacterium GW2011_GWF1_31_48]KKP34715.1 MAG: tRNA (guanine-N(1)-)-methyltransferase [Candidatus Nomurabacteria bacterium GW2011_GWE1_32_28]HAS80826.1 tRNA (guanosine(37)-N1)-methyltransferase TrmD [Candida